jgi:tRNA (Thr-GGU) A37 N-methylase
MKLDLIPIQPIGLIMSQVAEQQTGGFIGTDSLIELRAEFAEYLIGLQDFSHIHVIYWLTEMTDSIPTTQPQGNSDVPVVGMFACR